MTENPDNATPSTAQANTSPEEITLSLPGINAWQILLVAFVVAVFSVLWFGSYQALNNLIWHNDFVTANRWTIPVGVLLFSLIAGLAQKYLNASNAIEGECLDPITEGDTTHYKRTFVGSLISSYASLFSGASIGPEGPLGYLAVDVVQWLGQRLKLPKEGFVPAAMAGLSSAYNGIIGNSVFTAVLSFETSGGKDGLPALAANLAAGAVGYLIFRLFGVPPFAGVLEEGSVTEMSVELVLWAIGLGLLGSLLAVYVGVAKTVAGKALSIFDDRPVTRIMVAGAIIAVVCYFFPILMFAGEGPLESLMENPGQATVATLLMLAAAKPLLLALSLKSGYLGGPIFPILFSAVMLGLAISLLLPAVPVGVLTTCIAAGVLTMALGAPLSSILLVSLLTAADLNLIELIVVATVTAMLAGHSIKQLIARRNASSGDVARSSN